MAEIKQCQFCGSRAKYKSHGCIISYICGTVAGDQRPRTEECWEGFLMRLEDRVRDLEDMRLGVLVLLQRILPMLGMYPALYEEVGTFLDNIKKAPGRLASQG